MLDCTNGKFFSLGSLRAYGLVCAACVSLASNAWAQVDLDSWSQTPPATPAGDTGAEEDLAGQVAVSAYSTVDIHVQNTDLAKVLQMLSIQSQRNIIVSKNVSGTVSADLYDVTFFEALDAILNSNGYGYVEEGAFIKVYTLEELRTIKEAARQLDYRRFELSYLNATDASIFVTPLLSDKGTIAINGEVESGFKPDESSGGADSWASYATMVVHDYPEQIEEIARLIAELDTRPQQVLVEATVLQSALNEDNAWGVDWQILADVNFTDFTNPLSAVDDLLTGSGSGGTQPSDNKAVAVRNNVGQTQRAGGLKIGVISDDISVFLRVLDEVTDTTVVSRPRVLAVNRNRGQILIGRRIGYLSTTSTETSSTQTVQFLDTGTQLIFRPFVGKDGFIRMELKPSVSEGVIRDVTGSDGGTFTIPDQITQELQTNVVVRDGYTIVLGGLFREETTLTRRQIPILGDIPIIGAAFKGKDDTTRRSEITFLITPSIMKDEVLIAEGQRAGQLVDETRFAARTGVLQWSNDRLTSTHNIAAEQAIADGDYELALWHIDLSLHLRANQPLVIEMRERLLGKSEKWFHGSMMRHLTDERIDSSMNSISNAGKAVAEATGLKVDPLVGTKASTNSSAPIAQSVMETEPVEPTAVNAAVETEAEPTFEPEAPVALPDPSMESIPADSPDDVSWGASDDAFFTCSNPWWDDYRTDEGLQGYGASGNGTPNTDNTSHGVAINTHGDPCLEEKHFGMFVNHDGDPGYPYGQTLAICQALSPMGALYFGPIIARYHEAWANGHQTNQGIAEVPTDAPSSEPMK